MTATPRPRVILFLISDTGAGHRSAANAIYRAMRLLANDPDCARLTPARQQVNIPPETEWRAVIVDGVAECARFPFRHGVFLYGPVTKHNPRLFGQFFHLTNGPDRVTAVRLLCQPLFRPGLRRLIERVRPDVIVSAHGMFNPLIPHILRDCGVRVPFVSVVTDLITIHHTWLAPDAAACATPTEAARQFLIANGMAPQRVHTLGLPIDPAFAQPPKGSIGERRAAQGLDPAAPVVLLVGGGEGVGGLADVAQALSLVEAPAQCVIVTGRNRRLYDELQAARSTFRMPTQVRGFVTDMPDLMRAADIIITKAGSLTITEAMACQLPIILMGALPGQEEGNVDFLRESDIGVYAPDPEAVAPLLQDLLQPGSQRLTRMRAQAAHYSLPHASFDIARLIYSCMPMRSPWAERPHSAAGGLESLRLARRWRRLRMRASRRLSHPATWRNAARRLTGADLRHG